MGFRVSFLPDIGDGMKDDGVELSIKFYLTKLIFGYIYDL